jgi:hypothetical protein
LAKPRKTGYTAALAERAITNHCEGCRVQGRQGCACPASRFAESAEGRQTEIRVTKSIALGDYFVGKKLKVTA